MYKILSIILAGSLLVLGVFYIVEKKSNAKHESELFNQVAKLESVVKETNTAYSKKAIEVEDLKLKNKDLQKKIDKKDEEIAVAGRAVLEWKDKYYKILNAQGSTVDNQGNPVEIPVTCKDCLKDLRFKVDFQQEQNGLLVSGFTLTNPAYSEVRLHWTKPLVLDLVLTKDENDKFVVYVDTNDAGLVPTDIKVSVDKNVFNHKWYEKIQLDANVGVYQGLITSLGIGYDILDNVNIGPTYSAVYDGNKLRHMYGVHFGWYVFR